MKKHYPWFIPLALFLLLAPITPWLDLKIARFFYTLGEGTVEHFVSHPFFEFMYVWALVPGQLLIVLSFLVYLLSWGTTYFAKWRQASLAVILTASIGAGLISHALLKDHWGRPRPKQVIEFGGTQEFHPWYQPDIFNPIESKSFPCGHCTMGFLFFSVALIGRGLNSRILFVGGLLLAIALGTGLGLTRMAQGGHFLSDVLASGLILWIAAWGASETLK